MKELKIQNKDLSAVYNFLNKIELPGKASRGRSRLMTRLEEKIKEYAEDEQELKADYFVKDEEGNLVADDRGQLTWLDYVTESDKALLTHELTELGQEMATINFTEYSSKYEALFEALDNHTQPLKGQDAMAYDLLLDAYEENEKENENE